VRYQAQSKVISEDILTIEVRHKSMDQSVLMQLADKSGIEVVTEADKKLLNAAAQGASAICGPDLKASNNNPAHVEDWGKEREISPPLLVWLCSSSSVRPYIRPNGIQVYGGRISHLVDLSRLSLPFPLVLQACRFDDDFLLIQIDVAQLELSGSYFAKRVLASSAVIRQYLNLNGVKVKGGIDISAAQVGEDVWCGGGTVESPNGPSLNAYGLIAKGDVLLNDGFASTGEVKLSKARIDGNLNCTRGHFSHPLTGSALNGQGLIVGNVFLREGFRAEGLVDLSDAQINGKLNCNGGTFSILTKVGLTDPTVLNASRLKSGGDVLLASSFSAVGAVQLSGARINENLDCTGGSFSTPGAVALNAQGLIVKNVFLREGFRAEGVVDLSDAQIAGSLDCNGGTFVDGPAATTMSVTARQSGGGQTTTGPRCCDEYKRKNPHDNAKEESQVLKCNWAKIGEYVSLSKSGSKSKGFCAKGEVNFTSAKVGELDTSGGDFSSATLNLTDTTVNVFRDSRRSWPPCGHIFLEGFVYGRIDSDAPGARDRLCWLALTEFKQGPYVQLAKIYDDEGLDEDATEVRIEMERLKAEAAARTNRLQRWRAVEGLIGYGYRPSGAIGISGVVTLLGWILYRRSYLAGTIVPTDKDAFENFIPGIGTTSGYYPRFSALIFSLETSLPLVKLGQADKWGPGEAKKPASAAITALPGTKASPQIVPSPPDNDPGTASPPQVVEQQVELRPIRGLGRVLTSNRFVTWAIWVQIFVGWFLATLIVAAVAEILKKQ
jgi:hypothetical protein